MKRHINKVVPYIVETDGITVWVNGEGVCLGRFSKFGIDVHQDMEGQLAHKVCLDCVPFPRMTATVAEWERFRTGMLNHHKVTVPENFKPDWITDAAE